MPMRLVEQRRHSRATGSPIQATKPWTLPGGAGTKTVYVQFRDKAGNISDADPVKAGAQSYRDTIEYTGP